MSEPCLKCQDLWNEAYDRGKEIERLRAELEQTREKAWPVAADLADECNRLRAEVAEWRSTGEQLALARMQPELDAAVIRMAQNERLWEALQHIADGNVAIPADFAYETLKKETRPKTHLKSLHE